MKLEDFMKEAQIMMDMHHPNLLQLLGISLSSSSGEEPFFIITEFMPHGSLLNYLREDVEEKRIKVPEMINIISQVAKGDNFHSCIHFICNDHGAQK